MTGRYVMMKKRSSPDKKFMIIHSDGTAASSACKSEGMEFSFKRINEKSYIYPQNEHTAVRISIM